MKFIVYDITGKILSTGSCPTSAFPKQAREGEFVMEGTASDVRQKIVKGKIVDKTPAEIKKDNPKTEVQPPARITEEQWQFVLDRLSKLEAKQCPNTHPEPASDNHEQSNSSL